jgi:hypothetical protein
VSQVQVVLAVAVLLDRLVILTVAAVAVWVFTAKALMARPVVAVVLVAAQEHLQTVLLVILAVVLAVMLPVQERPAAVQYVLSAPVVLANSHQPALVYQLEDLLFLVVGEPIHGLRLLE